MPDSVQDPSADSLSACAPRLARPVRAVALADLPGVWFHAVVSVLVPGAAGLAADPALPGKVRGALGARLVETASAEARAGRACPWQPPCTLDVLFGRHGKVAGGLEVPKPYVLRLDAEGADLRVGLVLFGFASRWAEAAAEALVLGLRSGLSVPGAARGLEVSHRAVVAADGLDASAPPAGPGRAVLRFRTPLALRSGDAVKGGASGLFSSLGNRISGLARWQDCTVEADWPALARHARALRYDESGLAPAGWERASRRQGRSGIPVEGLLGTLAVEGDLAPVWPLLTLGELCHAGSRASLGLGRYETSFENT